MNDLNSTPDFVLIPLTQNQSAMVSLEDADLAEFKWYAIRGRKDKSIAIFYAARATPTRLTSECLMHRAIMERMLGRPMLKTEFVDHANGNDLDNRRSNLRLATKQQNAMNKKHIVTSSSPYKGVTFNKKERRWVAQIQANGKKIALGRFKTPEAAYQAYCNAARLYFGEFANLG